MTWTLSAFADEAAPSCDEQIQALQRAGLRHIDIRGIDGHNITVLPLEQAKIIRQKLDAAGIQVNMFGSPLGKIDLADDMKIDLDKLTHLGALAPILGCRAVRIFSYYNRKAPRPFETFRREALARLRQLTARAADLGLVLYHENEADILGDKCRDVLDLLQQLRTDNGQGTFRAIFDFGNYNCAKENVWENWQTLRHLTDAFHFKDNLWQNNQLHHVPIGAGQGQALAILQDAVAQGWQGPVTIEPHLQHSPAVLATGPSGVANQSFQALSAQDCFHVACVAAKDICAKVGAKLA